MHKVLSEKIISSGLAQTKSVSPQKNEDSDHQRQKFWHAGSVHVSEEERGQNY